MDFAISHYLTDGSSSIMVLHPGKVLPSFEPGRFFIAQARLVRGISHPIRLNN